MKCVHECLLWQLWLVQPRAVSFGKHCGTAPVLGSSVGSAFPVFPFAWNYPKWCRMLQPVHKACLNMSQMMRTSCDFCFRSHWQRLTKPLSHVLPPVPTKQLRTWTLHWSVGSITWVLKDWKRVDDISLSVFGMTEGNGSVKILSLWGYYYNQMLRFSKHAPWFVFALQCECGSQLLWTVLLSAKPGTKYDCAAWNAS